MRFESAESMSPRKISVRTPLVTRFFLFNRHSHETDLATAKVLNKHDDKEMSLSKLWK
jgi:hypothetical protein